MDPNYTVNDDGTVTPSGGAQQVYHVQPNGMVALNPVPQAPTYVPSPIALAQQVAPAPTPQQQPQQNQPHTQLPWWQQLISGALAPIAPGAAYLTSLDYRNQKGLDTLRNLIGKKESGGNYLAKNPHTSASGAYQYTDGTWAGYGGYPQARIAPKEVQDQRINEDLQHRLSRFNGDPFKVIAAHYMPAYADNPASWTEPAVATFGHKRVTVDPVAKYIAYVVKGTPLEAQFAAYMQQQLHPQQAP